MQMSLVFWKMGDAMSRQQKYFIVSEGSDRAIMRSSLKQALKKKRTIERWKCVKAHIYVSNKKLNVEEMENGSKK